MRKQKVDLVIHFHALFQNPSARRSRLSRLRAGALFLILALAFSRCVSVNIGPGQPKKSKDVKFTAPPAPFAVFKSANADHAWVNHRNGNSISYLSVCNDPADPPLDSATQDLFADLHDLQILKTDHLTFDGREAVRTEVKGDIDGVPTEITALVYKRNSCLYTINYVGVLKKYDEDRAAFETFLKSFEAP